MMTWPKQFKLSKQKHVHVLWVELYHGCWWMFQRISRTWVILILIHHWVYWQPGYGKNWSLRIETWPHFFDLRILEKFLAISSWTKKVSTKLMDFIDGLVEVGENSCALAVEFPQPCTKPLLYWWTTNTNSSLHCGLGESLEYISAWYLS